MLYKINRSIYHTTEATNANYVLKYVNIMRCTLCIKTWQCPHVVVIARLRSHFICSRFVVQPISRQFAAALCVLWQHAYVQYVYFIMQWIYLHVHSIAKEVKCVCGGSFPSRMSPEGSFTTVRAPGGGRVIYIKRLVCYTDISLKTWVRKTHSTREQLAERLLHCSHLNLYYLYVQSLFNKTLNTTNFYIELRHFFIKLFS
jgi:hypothetical protein